MIDCRLLRQKVAVYDESQQLLSLIPFFHWFLTDQMQTCNRSRGSGPEAQLEIVPFCSGEDPTKEPVSVTDSCLYDVVNQVCLSTISQLFPPSRLFELSTLAIGIDTMRGIIQMKNLQLPQTKSHKSSPPLGHWSGLDALLEVIWGFFFGFLNLVFNLFCKNQSCVIPMLGGQSPSSSFFYLEIMGD
jgi:hypothetical protein